ncbi:hypothetical protein ACV1DN_20915 [Aeromonas allosaccharophila]
MFYSKSTGGFYDVAIHGDNMPGDVVEITAEEHVGLLAGVSARQGIESDADGYPFLTAPPPPTNEEIAALLVADVQAHMDAQAKALGYDDIKSAVTYAAEPAVPKFQSEGQVFREWRSLCWAHCYAAMAAVHLGERAIPTAAELIAELPALVLPS